MSALFLTSSFMFDSAAQANKFLAELRTAFQMGLTILLPFLVIDLVAATILTSLGMVMVPPSVVALPLKLLVFVLIDGWHLVVQSLLRGAVA